MTYVVAIAVSRAYFGLEREICAQLDVWLDASHPHWSCVVTNGLLPAAYAEAWAHRRGLQTQRMEPQWRRFGRDAEFEQIGAIEASAQEAFCFVDNTCAVTVGLAECFRLAAKPVTRVSLTAKKCA